MSESNLHSSRRHPCTLEASVLLEDCSIRRGRASGPGGQHRNKVETAVEITHRPTGIQAHAYERRSQEENRKVALTRLRLLLAVNHRAVLSNVVEPSRLWVSRCRQQKISCNERHEDFPTMLAEALDAIDAKDYDVKRAAAALGCSTSQLIRFVGRQPEALQHMNQQRQQRGMKALKT